MSATEAIKRDETKLGYIAACCAYVIWGGLPLFIHALNFADPMDILGERILWSLPAALLAVGLMSGWRNGFAELKAAFRPPMLGMLTASAIFIFGNWALYVIAVVNGHVMEAALAYFISPLATVLIGVVVFGERLRAAQIAAVALAAVGVVMQGVALGAPPWLSLLLCASWVAYTVIRKKAPVSAAVGLMVETIILAPVAVGLLIWVSMHGGLAFGHDAGRSGMLALTGVVTALPLILFSVGARRLPLSAIGLINYLAPSLQFLAGLLLGELMTPLRVVSFAFIWLALIVFVTDSLAAERARRQAASHA